MLALGIILFGKKYLSFPLRLEYNKASPLQKPTVTKNTNSTVTKSNNVNFVICNVKKLLKSLFTTTTNLLESFLVVQNVDKNIKGSACTSHNKLLFFAFSKLKKILAQSKKNS